VNYYQFHIGDYRSATAHLSNEEDLAYRRLLDMYYDTEMPIPLDTQWVSRRLRVGSEVVSIVLADFFVKADDGWVHKVCEANIAGYQHMQEKNRENGKKGGRPKNPVGFQLDSSGLPVVTHSEGNQEPITNNHKPITNTDNNLSGCLSSADAEDAGFGDLEPESPKLAVCPQKEILALWARHLPNLSQPRSWEGMRPINLKSRWIQASRPSTYSPNGYTTRAEGLEWWAGFFSYIATQTTLPTGFGKQGERPWRPDLEWVVKQANFQKIIDGKYNK